MKLPKQIGRYRIDELLGSGAMGSVFKGFDPVIKRVVAIKTIKAEAIANHDDPEQFKKRFFNEARICGQLHHPNIVMLYDLGEESGTPFIAMEYLKGRSLQSVIKSQTERDFDFCIKVLEQLAAALDYAHQRDVIHRDIKPQNVMVAEDGTAKIMDFGIAKFSDSHMTKTGFFVGTPSYSSPEQIAGSKVDHRTDIFSLGVLAHELITGRLPFVGTSISSVLYQVVNGLPTLDYVPPQLDASVLMFKQVFLKVLNKDREKRHQRARAFVADLQDLLAACLKSTLSLPTVSGIPRDSSAFDQPTPQSSATKTPQVEVESEVSLPADTDGREAPIGTGAAAGSVGPVAGASAFDKSTVRATTPVPAEPPPRQAEADDRAAAKARKIPLPLVIAIVPMLLLAAVVTIILVRQREPIPPSSDPIAERIQRNLTITTDPPGAQVTLDGKSIGQTPLNTDIDLSDGENLTLLASMEDYASESVEIGSDFAFDQPLSLSLKPLTPDPSDEPPVNSDPDGESVDVQPAKTSEGDDDHAGDVDVVAKPDPQKQENDFWARVQKNPTLETLQTYLDRYPNGKYRDRAVSEIQIVKERQAYQLAIDSNDEALLGDFLAVYPNSRFAGAVRDRLRVFEMRRAVEAAVSGNDLASVDRVIKEYAPYLNDSQRSQLTQRRQYLETLQEELTAFETARVSNDLNVLQAFLEKYRDQNPWHTEEIIGQQKRVKANQRSFLQKNLDHNEQTKYKMTKNQSGLDIECSFRQKPDFDIGRVEVVWELDGVPQEPLAMTRSGDAYAASIPYSDLKEGSLNYYFSVKTENETYQLDKMWFQTRIKDARKKIVISF